MTDADPEIKRTLYALFGYAKSLLLAGHPPEYAVSMLMELGVDRTKAELIVRELVRQASQAQPKDPGLDYYEVLQVSPAAEPDVIQAAYKRLALKYHPDRNHDPDAEKRMRRLNEAYETLSDPQRRRAYDTARKLPSGGNGAQASSIPEPDPETRRQIQELNQYVNLLLDRQEPVAGVVKAVMEKGFDRKMSVAIVQAVLANRLTVAFPAAGSNQTASQAEKMKQLKQVMEYINLLLDDGEGVPGITRRLLEMRFDQDVAGDLINAALACRKNRSLGEGARSVWQDVIVFYGCGLIGTGLAAGAGGLLFFLGSLALGGNRLFWAFVGGIVGATIATFIATVWCWQCPSSVRERLSLCIAGLLSGLPVVLSLVWFTPSSSGGFGNLKVYGIALVLVVLVILWGAFMEEDKKGK